MLMMLPNLGGCEARGCPADAHDAGLFAGSWVEDRPADAHVAGLFWGSRVKVVQLMLMMLVCLFVGCNTIQLMLLMLA